MKKLVARGLVALGTRGRAGACRLPSSASAGIDGGTPPSHAHVDSTVWPTVIRRTRPSNAELSRRGRTCAALPRTSPTESLSESRPAPRSAAPPSRPWRPPSSRRPPPAVALTALGSQPVKPYLALQRVPRHVVQRLCKSVRPSTHDVDMTSSRPTCPTDVARLVPVAPTSICREPSTIETQ